MVVHRPPARPQRGGIDYSKLAALIAEHLRDLANVPDVMDSKRAAKYLGYSTFFLEKQRHTGDGPPFVQVAERIVRYRRVDLDNWLASRVRKNTANP